MKNDLKPLIPQLNAHIDDLVKLNNLTEEETEAILHIPTSVLYALENIVMRLEQHNEAQSDC